MSLRYAEMDVQTSGASDFIVRNRHPAIKLIVGLVLAIALLSAALIFLTSNKYLQCVLLLLILGGIGWYVILQVQRNQDLLLATEFQNALFASALGINNKFCIIIRKDGNIVYLDRAFQEIFPDFMKQSRRSLDALLEQGKVSNAEIEKIYKAITEGVFEKVIFNILGAGKLYYKIVMSIEPIMRPAGFIMLRGREYVENRSAEADAQDAQPNMLSSSTITMFSDIMNNMNVGLYMTDPNGTIVYANPVLERWLNFNEGEIVSGNLSISDLIHHHQQNVREIVPDNYEGEIVLKKKAGGHMKSFMNQKIIRNSQNKLMGCTAIIQNVVDNSQEPNKKLW